MLPVKVLADQDTFDHRIQERGHSILAGFQISGKLNQMSCDILTKIRRVSCAASQKLENVC